LAGIDAKGDSSIVCAGSIGHRANNTENRRTPVRSGPINPASAAFRVVME
jgi:hypothetical protein